MNLFWGVLIIASIVVFLFAIVPSIISNKAHIRPPVRARRSASPYETSVLQARAMLDAHYVDAKGAAPEDFPRRSIGACPYTKPPSTDLPLPDLPLCVVQKSGNMKLV